MSYRYVEQPSIAESRVAIETFWETSILSAGTYIVLPDGRMDLVARCDGSVAGDERIAAVAIIGASSRPARIPVEADQLFLGARYAPGFGGCLGVAPAVVADTAVRGDGVRAALGEDMGDLMRARGLTQIREAFVALASRRASMAAALPDAARVAIELLHRSAGTAAVSELASQTGTPERTLRRYLHQAVGLSPKAFAGVLRFQKAMRLMTAEPAPTLADVAAACGYSGQAHLTRECRRFGGFSPGQRLPVTLVSMPLGSLAD